MSTRPAVIVRADLGQKANTTVIGVEPVPADRRAAAKGIMTGILLGTGFWVVVLAAVFRH